MQAIETILSIYILILAGFVIQKFTNIEDKALTKVIVFILLPALVFVGFLEKEFSSLELFLPALFAGLLLLIGGFGYLVGKLLKLPKEKRNILSATSTMSNTGNYGIPFCVAVLGKEALPITALIVLGSTIITFTWGAYIISAGKNSFKQSLKNVVKLPLIYAFLAAVLIKSLNITIPGVILNPITMLGDASIPMFLVLLGIFLAKMKRKHISFKMIGAATILKLMIMPAAAFGIAYFLKLPELIFAVFVLEAAMPTAVNTINLSSLYNVQPKTTAAIVFITTLLSLGTLTVISFLV